MANKTQHRTLFQTLAFSGPYPVRPFMRHLPYSSLQSSCHCMQVSEWHSAS